MTKRDKPGRPKNDGGMTFDQCDGIIKAHRKAYTTIAKTWDRRRAWFQSKWGGQAAEQPQGAGEEADYAEINFETNSSYAFVDSMIASVVPLNPQVTVNPRRPDLDQFARAREALANDRMTRMKLYEKLWLMSTHSAIYQRGFMKLSWNPAKTRARLRVVDPRYIFFDQGAEDWEAIRYIIEVTVITKETFMKRIKDGVYDKKIADKAAFGGYPAWLKDKHTDKTHMNDAARDVFNWVTVYEFYDFTTENGKFYHYIEDQKAPLYAGELPYRLQRNPYRILTFNDNLEDIGGMSDIQLIEAALDQLNELDVLQLTFAKASLPQAFIHSGLAKNPAGLIEGYRTGGDPGSFVEIMADPGTSIQDVVTFSRPPGLVPEHSLMREKAMETINFVLGLPEYARGAIGGSDIATEVALADSATRTRNGRRQKRVYSVVAWVAESIINLYEEFYPDTDSLYIRLTDDEEMIDITRETSGFRQMKAEMDEAPLEYDFEVIPYSPTENSRLVQLKNLTQSWNLIEWSIGMGFLDEQKLSRHIGQVLQLPPNVFLSKAEVEKKQQIMAQGAEQPPGGMGPPPPGGGEDTLATGMVEGSELEPTDSIGLPFGGPGDGGGTTVARGKNAFPEN